MSGICIPLDLPRITTPAVFASPMCYAWNTWDLTGGFDNRGDSTFVPHVAGRFPEPLRPDEREYELNMVVISEVGIFGLPNSGPPVNAANQGEGLEANLNYLRTFIDADGGTGSAWTLTMPSLATRAANVQVVSRLKVGEVVDGVDWLNVYGLAAACSITIRMSAGGFV